jgi:hypothetical protein
MCWLPIFFEHQSWRVIINGNSSNTKPNTQLSWHWNNIHLFVTQYRIIMTLEQRSFSFVCQFVYYSAHKTTPHIHNWGGLGSLPYFNQQSIIITLQFQSAIYYHHSSVFTPLSLTKHSSLWCYYYGKMRYKCTFSVPNYKTFSHFLIHCLFYISKHSVYISA